MDFQQLTAGELAFSLTGLSLGVALALFTAFARYRYSQEEKNWHLDVFVGAVAAAFVLLAVVGTGFLVAFAGGVLSSADMAVGALMAFGGLGSFALTQACAFSGLMKNNRSQVSLLITSCGVIPIVRPPRDDA